MNEIDTIGGVSTLIGQDAAGNVSLAPMPGDWSSAYTMVYDAWNRLMTTESYEEGFYQYDGLHRRTHKFYTDPLGNHALDTYYNSSWQIVEEQFSNLPNEQYVWGLLGIDNLVLRDRSSISERLYAFSDYASVRAIANASGTVEERYDYNAYGFPLFMDASWSSLSDSAYYWQALYDTYHRDIESGFYQVRNRYLHPTLGRWLTRDPVGYDGGINLYAYVGNRPVNQVDPEGLTAYSAKNSVFVKNPNIKLTLTCGVLTLDLVIISADLASTLQQEDPQAYNLLTSRVAGTIPDLNLAKLNFPGYLGAGFTLKFVPNKPQKGTDKGCCTTFEWKQTTPGIIYGQNLDYEWKGNPEHAADFPGGNYTGLINRNVTSQFTLQLICLGKKGEETVLKEIKWSTHTVVESATRSAEVSIDIGFP